MTHLGLHDQFGRPDCASLIALGRVTLIAAITGSVWPPLTRSVCPPVDRKSGRAFSFIGLPRAIGPDGQLRATEQPARALARVA